MIMLPCTITHGAKKECATKQCRQTLIRPFGVTCEMVSEDDPTAMPRPPRPHRSHDSHRDVPTGSADTVPYRRGHDGRRGSRGGARGLVWGRGVSFFLVHTVRNGPARLGQWGGEEDVRWRRRWQGWGGGVVWMDGYHASIHLTCCSRYCCSGPFPTRRHVHARPLSRHPYPPVHKRDTHLWAQCASAPM